MKVCGYCKTEYESKRRHSQYCCDRCRWLAWDGRNPRERKGGSGNTGEGGVQEGTEQEHTDAWKVPVDVLEHPDGSGGS